MLFNSYEFLFVFLPLTFAGYFLLHYYARPKIALGFLVVASLVFYSYWTPQYLLLILASIIGNYTIGTLIQKGSEWKTPLLIAGITLNLGLLAYYKYADFFIENLNALAGFDYTLLGVVLPIGISFFTFTQIAFLVDAYKGLAKEYDPINYALFVTFFPHLIAGPILHHKEMMPQFADSQKWRINWNYIALGLFIFSIGLAKKEIIADSIAVWANAGFDATQTLTFVEAWMASIAYSLQLYFDFSAYSDMAIGLALLFNITLPENFNSPYKALTIQDFWRRWHMTLSRFLRDYLYIPLGGNRKGEVMMLRNLVIVFLLGGLWHGAGWTFIVWGALHGAAYIVYHLWKKSGHELPDFLAWIVMLLFVNITWVFFRAESLPHALMFIHSMVGLNGVSLPMVLSGMGSILPEWISFGGVFGWAGVGSFIKGAVLIAGALAIALYAPNSLALSSRFKPTHIHAITTVVMMLLALYLMSDVSEFIYFNF